MKIFSSTNSTESQDEFSLQEDETICQRNNNRFRPHFIFKGHGNLFNKFMGGSREEEEPLFSNTNNQITALNYKDGVKSLSRMTIVQDPFSTFEHMMFMFNSSAENCSLFLANTIGDPEDRYVVKITALKRKQNVIDVENELRLMKLCDHKNIVKVHRAYAHNNSMHISVKYCKHGCLTKFLEKIPVPTEKQIAYICSQILSAIDHMHRLNNILHLDIKSDNILVDEDYSMIITDFGLSVQLCSSNATFDQMRGTPYWMAPEIIGHSKVCYNHKADIWSFGIVVWEILHENYWNTTLSRQIWAQIS